MLAGHWGQICSSSSGKEVHFSLLYPADCFPYHFVIWECSLCEMYTLVLNGDFWVSRDVWSVWAMKSVKTKWNFPLCSGSGDLLYVWSLVWDYSKVILASKSASFTLLVHELGHDVGLNNLMTSWNEIFEPKLKYSAHTPQKNPHWNKIIFDSLCMLCFVRGFFG